MPKTTNNSPQFNPSQQKAIGNRNKNTLVSASAGTGKTTVMMERLFQMVQNDDVDLSNVVVVTFTKLAANQMKEKLTSNLMQQRNNVKVLQQLEKIDSCAISTLHSFCGNLLRNYFYVVDIDPNYTMLDDYSLANLKCQCFKQVLDEFYQADDQQFDNLYKIYSPKRNDAEFTNAMLKLYEHSRTHVNFWKWYDEMRQNYLNFQGSPLEAQLNSELAQLLNAMRSQWLSYASQGDLHGVSFYVDACQQNADLCSVAPTNSFRTNFGLIKAALCGFATIPKANSKDWSVVDADVKAQLSKQFLAYSKECKARLADFCDYDDELDYDVLTTQTAQMVAITDKMVQVLQRFDEVFAATKRKSGVVDFNDLEHFALRILDDAKCRSEVHAQYKYVFVDEHQDTNPVQAEIIKRLVGPNRLFLVGDVKQSIYGFRGCTPNNFADNQTAYQADQSCNYVELNQNYRSDNRILSFVNNVMAGVMTKSFGKIDYASTSMLQSRLYFDSPLPPVTMDVVKAPEGEYVAKQQPALYDPTTSQPTAYDKIRAEGLAVAYRIQQLVGKSYVDKATGKTKTYTYQDFAILTRGRGAYAFEIYNVLLEQNIPVVGSFKMQGLKNKEVRMLISLLRVIDNPHNDVSMVGLLLSSLCGLDEQQLAQIKIESGNVKASFYQRAMQYAEANNDQIACKLQQLFARLNKYRLFSFGATVDQLLLEVIADTNLHLYVSGLSNASLRIKKMYDFVDQIKDKHYSQSIDKFLQFLDETSFEEELDEEGGNVSAVRFMTMHAAKGLEFPVVIIIGCNRMFNFDKDVLAYDVDNGIALDYYNFDSRIKSNSLGAFATKRVKKRSDLAEELRLLYVALTRAQVNLIITLADAKYDDWTDKKMVASNVSCFAQWLVRAAYNQLGSFSDGAHKDGLFLSFLTEDCCVVPSDSQSSFLSNQSDNLQHALDCINYVYPYTHQVVPSKITSSTLDAQHFNMSEQQEQSGLIWQPLVQDVDKMQLGTAYHKVYETISYDADANAIAAHVQALVDQGVLEQSVASHLDVGLVYATLTNPTFRQIVSSGKVYHEMPFLMQTEYSRFVEEASNAPTLLQGIIDLLVVGKDKATIVDFKYVSNSHNLHQRYAKQLQSYRYAVESILKMDVDCYLLSIADNKLVKID
ncbi:MAG: UvrD-helicase domain-containing protein [Clostridia bacterium]|nr:UvrD-helicase domain-containing protein [Clostridia bacterium]